jgi:F-type H+-transporting ATPase subunit alpha
VEEQVASIFAATKGFLDELPLGRVKAFEKEYLDYLRANGKAQLEAIAKTGELSDETEKGLLKLAEEFTTTFAA